MPHRLIPHGVVEARPAVQARTPRSGAENYAS
jgi:hypothetical protein